MIQHRLGYTSWYAHLSRVTSWVGERVSGGTRIGYVGATGHATGPNLHFEVRYRNVPIDPAPLLLATTATAARGAALPRARRLPHRTSRRLPLAPVDRDPPRITRAPALMQQRPRETPPRRGPGPIAH